MPMVFACSCLVSFKCHPPAAVCGSTGGFFAPEHAPSNNTTSRIESRGMLVILAHGGGIGYNRRLLLNLFHDLPSGASQAHFDRFLKEDVLARLRRLDDDARRKGLDALDPK